MTETRKKKEDEVVERKNMTIILLYILRMNQQCPLFSIRKQEMKAIKKQMLFHSIQL